MKGPQLATPDQDQLAEVVKRYLAGESAAEIARRLGLPPLQVNGHLALARRRWAEGAIRSKNEGAELERQIEAAETTFLREWARLAPRTPGRGWEEEPNEDAVPDYDVDDDRYPHVLAVVTTCMEERARLIGGQVSKTNATAGFDDIDAMSAEEVDSELERLGYGAQLKRTQTSA